jgi:hypothetical protein
MKDPASKRQTYTPLERPGVPLLVLNGTLWADNGQDTMRRPFP